MGNGGTDVRGHYLLNAHTVPGKYNHDLVPKQLELLCVCVGGGGDFYSVVYLAELWWRSCPHYSTCKRGWECVLEG